jgi:hypothetical protein
MGPVPLCVHPRFPAGLETLKTFFTVTPQWIFKPKETKLPIYGDIVRGLEDRVLAIECFRASCTANELGPSYEAPLQRSVPGIKGAAAPCPIFFRPFLLAGAKEMKPPQASFVFPSPRGRVKTGPGRKKLHCRNYTPGRNERQASRSSRKTGLPTPGVRNPRRNNAAVPGRFPAKPAEIMKKKEE